MSGTLKVLFETVYEIFQNNTKITESSIVIKDFLIYLNTSLVEKAKKKLIANNYLITYTKEAKENNISQPLLLLVQWLADRSSYLYVSHSKTAYNPISNLDNKLYDINYTASIALAVNDFQSYVDDLKLNLGHYFTEDAKLFSVIMKFIVSKDDIIESVDCETILNELKEETFMNDKIKIYVENAVDPVFSNIKNLKKYHPTVQELIENNNKFKKLYKHQAIALDHLIEKQNICVNTSTASGKSLIYIIYAYHILLSGQTDCILCIYPTKALAQNQLITWRSINYELKELNSTYEPVKISTLDGDTPAEIREELLQFNRVLLTNFDFIHKCLVTLIGTVFFRNLNLVVIDEAHVYKGIYGTHVAYIIRRLHLARRYCLAEYVYRLKTVSEKQYNNIQYVLSTATLGNPLTHSCKLTGEDNFVLIDNDGSPKSKHYYIIWNPSNNAIDGDISGIKLSSITEAIQLFNFLLRRRVRTFLFCNARTLVEYIYDETLKLLYDVPEIRTRVISYRAGYSNDYRRKLESSLFTNSILGVVCTNALELGIDIGVLDCVISLGFEGSISSVRQRLGRAGRRQERPCFGFLITFSNPVENYIFNHMGSDFWIKEPESIGFSLNDDRLLKQHILCCLNEIAHPIHSNLLVQLFGNEVINVLQNLINTREVVCYKNEFYKYKHTTLLSLFGNTMEQSKNLQTEETKTANKIDLIKQFNENVSLNTFTEAELCSLLQWSDPTILNVQTEKNSYNDYLTVSDVYTNQFASNEIRNPAHVIDIRTSSMPLVLVYTINATTRDAADITHATTIEELGKSQIDENISLTNCVKIDEIMLPLSYFYCYPGAIYTYQGKKYISQLFNPRRLICLLQSARENINYYTKPCDITNYTLVDQNYQAMIMHKKKNIGTLHIGKINGVVRVAEYVRIYKNKKVERNVVHIPPFLWNTYGLKIVFSNETILQYIKNINNNDFFIYRQACHGLGHLMLKILQTKSLCTETDLSFNCTNFIYTQSYQTPIDLFIFEQSTSISNGIVDSIFNYDNACNVFISILEDCIGVLEKCECSKTENDGCLCCVVYPNCSDRNWRVSKQITYEFLKYLIVQ